MSTANWRGSLFSRSCLGLCLTLMACSCGCADKKGNGKASRPAGVSQADLQRCAPTLQGWWEQHNDIVSNDKSAWSGSAVVYKRGNGKLYLCTNSHCLALAALGKTAIMGHPEVCDYGLAITFPSGTTRRGTRMAETTRPLDISLLEIDAEGLEEGRDYVTLGFDPSIDATPGDEVVAVGTPLGWASTLTFGRISAWRQRGDVNIMQTDAAINHGNSDGPLLVKKNGLYYWVGINTSREEDQNAQGLGFAIHAGEIQKSQFSWYTCDKQGAAQAINEHYNIGAVAK